MLLRCYIKYVIIIPKTSHTRPLQSQVLSHLFVLSQSCSQKERERERISTWMSQTVIKRCKKKLLCMFNTSDPFSLLCLPLLAVVFLFVLMIFVFNPKQKQQLESINCNTPNKNKQIKPMGKKKTRSTRTMSQFESINCNSEHTEVEKHQVCFL